MCCNDLLPHVAPWLVHKLCEERCTSVLFSSVSLTSFFSPSHRIGPDELFYAELVIEASDFFVSSYRVGIGLAHIYIP